MCEEIQIKDLPDAVVSGAMGPTAVTSEVEEDAEQQDDEALSEVYVEC